LLYGDAQVVEDDGHIATKFLPIDLNNLFKYAVPKLTEAGRDIDLANTSKGWACCVIDDMGEACVEYDDPALALFWAIWEMIK